MEHFEDIEHLKAMAAYTGLEHTTLWKTWEIVDLRERKNKA